MQAFNVIDCAYKAALGPCASFGASNAAGCDPLLAFCGTVTGGVCSDLYNACP